MKILIINNTGLGMGGITKHILNYVSHISNMEFDVVSTMVPDEGLIQDFENAGCNIVYLPNRNKNTLKYFFELRKLIKTNEYNTVHVHGNSITMIIDIFWVWVSKVPVRVAHCHNSLKNHKNINLLLRPLFSKMYTSAIACSVSAGEWMFGKNKFSILRNAIDLEMYKFDESIRAAYRKEFQIDDNCLVVGHIGNFIEQKNHDFLIEIFKEIINKREAILVLVGMGSLQDKIKEKVKKISLEDKVKFLNVREDIHRLLSAFDVFLLPSKWEGLPICLIEAQANYLNCFVSDNVSKEVQLTELITFVPRSGQLQNWYKKLENISIRKGEIINTSVIEEISRHGYNIKLEADKLEKLYLGEIYEIK